MKTSSPRGGVFRGWRKSCTPRSLGPSMSTHWRSTKTDGLLRSLALLWSAALLWATHAQGVTQLVQAEPPAATPPALPTPAPPLEPPTPLEPPPSDQGPDTLPALEEPPNLTPPPLAPMQTKTPVERSQLPVRQERRLALLGELGWNSLAGFGPNITFHAHPHLSFDLGAGLGAIGGKIGLRARYNVLESEVTPFIGAGVMVGSGFDAPSSNLASDMENRELNAKILPSTFLQAVLGVDWTSRDGFTLIGAAGYAWLLGRDNVEIITGTPTADERRAFEIAFRSSIVISIAIGYSFR